MILRTVEQVAAGIPHHIIAGFTLLLAGLAMLVLLGNEQWQILAAERFFGLPQVPPVVRRDEHKSGVGVILHLLCKRRNELYSIERKPVGRIQFLFECLTDGLEFFQGLGRIPHCYRLKGRASG